MSRLDSDQWRPDPVAGYRPPQGVEAHDHQDNVARLASLETSRTADEANLALVTFGAWTSFTPTFTQNNVAVTKSVNYARYCRVGRLIVASVDLTATGAGTINTDLHFGLPVAAASGQTSFGTGRIYKASNFATYPSIAVWANANEAALLSTMSNGIQTQGSASSAYNFAVASGDGFTYQVIYEAAS